MFLSGRTTPNPNGQHLNPRCRVAAAAGPFSTYHRLLDLFPGCQFHSVFLSVPPSCPICVRTQPFALPDQPYLPISRNRHTASVTMSDLPSNVHVSQHPCLKVKLSQLRSKSTSPRDVKALVHEISLILGTEALAKTLTSSPGPKVGEPVTSIRLLSVTPFASRAPSGPSHLAAVSARVMSLALGSRHTRVNGSISV